MSLTSFDRLSENVRILPVIIPELKFGDIEQQVLVRDFDGMCHHAVFNKWPETLNRICVDRTDHVLLFRVIHRAALIEEDRFACRGSKSGYCGGA